MAYMTRVDCEEPPACCQTCYQMLDDLDCDQPCGALLALVSIRPIKEIREKQAEIAGNLRHDSYRYLILSKPELQAQLMVLNWVLKETVA